MDLKISNLQVADKDSSFYNGLIEAGWIRYGGNKKRMFFIWRTPNRADFWN